jgi:photosystem II stability/assembly factor-like uncharacterized protein
MTNTGHSNAVTWNSLLVLCLSICFVACSGLAQNTASTSDHTRLRGMAVPQRTITKIQSVIRTNDASLWKSSTKFFDKETFIGVQFLDRTNGWIATYEGSIYHTSDGGLEWERIKTPVPKGAYISSFFFTNISDGWIACGLNSPDVLNVRGNKAWLFQTRDGGHNWSLQYQNEAVQLSRLTFVNPQVGWAVGRQFVDGGNRPFLIKTTEEGANWIDLSRNVPAMENGNALTDVHADSSSDATLLTVNGDLLRTVNGGQRWQQIAALQDEPDQTYMGRLIKSPTGALLAVGGADSLEGFWGVLTRREPDGVFKQYRVNCYITDVLFVSEKTLFVAGHILGTSAFSPEPRQGVILHSSDGGQTWSTVYRGSVPSINAMTLSDNGVAWAVGERGLVLNLHSP